MTPDQIGNIFSFFQIGLLVKLFFLVLGFFYFVFTAVIYRQIDLMTQVLDSKISPVIKSVALIQIFSAAFLFLLIILFV